MVFLKAKGDWILSLDADERVSPELAEEIRLLFQQPEVCETSVNQ